MSVLDDAQAAVRERGAQYGHPSKNFQRIANLWNSYLFEGSAVLDVRDVAVMSALIKVARLIEDINHYDSWVDAAGYFDAGWRAESEKP